MCGRYALALRPSQIRRMLEDDNMPVDDAPTDDSESAPRSSYNFAPGYYGIVYRADSSSNASNASHATGVDLKKNDADHADPKAASTGFVNYKLQAMKWGLVPSWTKRNPDYGSILRTINCRSDSLSTSGGMWASMKARKRCIVVAQGFYEWLKVGPKDKIPHFTKREDGHLMCFAGLWDCVQYEGSNEKLYTYTIITTDSNQQLKFLHDRMPVILEPGSEELRKWLDLSRKEWSRELQSLLKPFKGKLTVYPVSKDVGKVGNNSPSFVIPLDSKENKSSIKNMFANAAKKSTGQIMKAGEGRKVNDAGDDKAEGEKLVETLNIGETSGRKRKIPTTWGRNQSPNENKRRDTGKISATKNHGRGEMKPTKSGSKKITQFFGKN